MVFSAGQGQSKSRGASHEAYGAPTLQQWLQVDEIESDRPPDVKDIELPALLETLELLLWQSHRGQVMTASYFLLALREFDH